MREGEIAEGLPSIVDGDCYPVTGESRFLCHIAVIAKNRRSETRMYAIGNCSHRKPVAG
jgi:hypothetical protein